MMTIDGEQIALVPFEVGDLVGLDEKGRLTNLSTVRYDGKGGFVTGPWR